MSTPEPNPRLPLAPSIPDAAPPAPSPIAPVWHTVILIAGVLVISATGASRIPGAHGQVHRLATYGTTGAMEFVLLAWVLIGLRLRKKPLRLLLGINPVRFKSLALDLGIAAVFWIGSMMVLGLLAFAWIVIQSAVTHQPLIRADGKPDPSQQRTLHTLGQLAPSNGEEIAAWILLCIAVGFIEETVFRGYLQQQFAAWGQGRAAIGVLFSAILFGLGHGYEGARSMFLIAVFGALFGILALFRRSLRPGMIAHGWHDLLTGLALAFLKSQHIL